MEYEKIFNKVLNFLDYQPRTVKEINDKVGKYTQDQKTLDKIIEDLEKMNLIDDFKYAVEYVESKANSSQPPGKRKMNDFLYRKGVKRQLIEQALDLYTFEKEENGAEIALQKRLGDSVGIINFKEKQKMWKFLLGRGYSKDVIDTVVDRNSNF